MEIMDQCESNNDGYHAYKNSKVGGSSPPQVETYSISKTSTPAHSYHFKWWMLTLLQTYLYRQSQYSKSTGQQMSGPGSSDG